MKFLSLLSISFICVLGSAYVGKSVTMDGLRDQNSIFDDFVTTPSGWLFSDKIGSEAASGVERAKVAIGGPLGLSSKEAVYFIAITDSDGERLISECDYRVSGGPIDSRWWSISLYDSETQHYVANTDNRSSWNSVSLPRDDADGWHFTVSQTPQVGSWLPAQAEDGRRYELNMRIYNPSADLRAKLPNITLPVVERVSC